MIFFYFSVVPCFKGWKQKWRKTLNILPKSLIHRLTLIINLIMSSCVAITCGLSAAGSRGAVASAAQQQQQQQRRLRDATPPVEEQGEGVSQAAGECLLLSGVGPSKHSLSRPHRQQHGRMLDVAAENTRQRSPLTPFLRSRSCNSWVLFDSERRISSVVIADISGERCLPDCVPSHEQKAHQLFIKIQVFSQSVCFVSLNAS